VKPLAVPVLTMCSMVGCKRSLAFELIRTGEVEAVRLGRRKTVVTVASIEAMLERNKVKRAPVHSADSSEATTDPASGEVGVGPANVTPSRRGAPKRQR
jgi:hypothetical protein